MSKTIKGIEATLLYRADGGGTLSILLPDKSCIVIPLGPNSDAAGGMSVLVRALEDIK